MTDNPTIYAVATAPGRAGIAVIRLSGPRTQAALAALGITSLPPPRLARLACFHDPRDGGIIDQGLLLWFPAPASFTGEDVAELQVHGSRAVLSALLSALSGLEGVRMAEPGEFARRAFLNGRMDLTEVEGLADLIDAETEAQRRQALRQMRGESGERYNRLRERAVRMLARMEAYIDFPEEEIPEAVVAQAHADAEALKAEIKGLLAQESAGRRIREGVNIVILGAPNAGKSSLMNALARRDVAIVSAQAGTTRDAIEVHLDIGGYAATLVDTAGLRDSEDPIEQEGIRRARAKGAQADIRLLLFDGQLLPALDASVEAMADESAIVVVSKGDSISGSLPEPLGGRKPLVVSAVTGAGLEHLFSALAAAIYRLAGEEDVIVTRERHKIALEQSVNHLSRFQEQAVLELQCEELRLASACIGRITGQVLVEELLDHIFKEFCIGK